MCVCVWGGVGRQARVHQYSLMPLLIAPWKIWAGQDLKDWAQRGTRAGRRSSFWAEVGGRGAGRRQDPEACKGQLGSRKGSVRSSPQGLQPTPGEEGVKSPCM